MAETLLRGDVSGDAEDVRGPMPVVSADQLNDPSLLEPPQAFRWFTDVGGRSGAGWTNVVTLVEPRSLLVMMPPLASPARSIGDPSSRVATVTAWARIAVNPVLSLLHN